jgi:hypothetical protein
MDFFKQKKSYILFLPSVFPENCPNEEEMLQSLSVVDEDEMESDSSESIIESEIIEMMTSDDSSNMDSRLTVMPNLFSAVDQNIEYETLPNYFTDLESWPKSTNRLCWLCSNSILGPPWFVAIQLLKRAVPIARNEDAPTDISTFIPSAEENFESLELPTKMKDVPALKVHGCFCSPYCVKRYILYVKDTKISNHWEAIKLLNIEYEYFIGKEVQDIPEADDPMIQIQYSGPCGITPQEYRRRNDQRRIT